MTPVPATSTPRTAVIALPVESRVIATPWSRIVRGIGLGQHPKPHDPADAARIRRVFALLRERVPATDGYTAATHELAETVLRACDPGDPADHRTLAAGLERALAAGRAEANPYYRLMAGCMTIEAAAKCGLAHLVLGPRALVRPAPGFDDVADEVLAMVDDIHPDGIADENAGRHGDYERLSASSAVFLAFWHLGIGDRLVSPTRDHIAEALDLIDGVPSPFFRGRGGSVLLSAVTLLGHADRVEHRIGEVLTYLDRADDIGSEPSFPSPMSPSFPRIYPLLTILNTVAVSGDDRHGAGRFDEALEYFAALQPTERTHMGLYLLLAANGAGQLDRLVPDLDGFVTDLVGSWRDIDPGADYFLSGIAYAYLVQTAASTGRRDLLPDEMLDRMVRAFTGLEGDAAGRANRPYPFSYTLTVLAEIGEAHRMFEPDAHYGGVSAVEWVVSRISANGVDEGNRLFMLDHALVNWALRQRGPGGPEPRAASGRWAG
jgi:hypothetical protein